jgi:hypothetical protein
LTYNTNRVKILLTILRRDKTMFCVKCGAQLPDGTAFCSSCGASLCGTQSQPVYVVVQKPQLVKVNTKKDIVSFIFGFITLLLGFVAMSFSIEGQSDAYDIASYRPGKYVTLYGYKVWLDGGWTYDQHAYAAAIAGIKTGYWLAAATAVLAIFVLVLAIKAKRIYNSTPDPKGKRVAVFTVFSKIFFILAIITVVITIILNIDIATNVIPTQLSYI